MFDYNIEDAQRILKSFDSADLRLDDHVLVNWFERDVSFDYIFNCLRCKIPLSISKTMENRFKLVYPHEKIKSKDFYIVIELMILKKLKLLQLIHSLKQGGNVKLKENNIQEVIYMYDSSSDVLGIKVIRDFQYGETIEMDDGLLLDFDEDNIPVSLEVLDASKRFSLPKESLKNIICFKMDVCVDEKSISIDATLGVLVENVENTQFVKSFASNLTNIPEISTQLALV